jgi:CRISPR/Cas system CSM-associated protein Csm3 (group 7 of RAMP superfamily)
MPRQRFKITLGVRAPFLFAAIEPSTHGIDSSALRNAAGYPVLPGDHLRGHLRHAAMALFDKGTQGDPAEVIALFGTESAQRSSASAGPQDQPARGALIVSDLVAIKARHGAQSLHLQPDRLAVYHRVKIDPETGAADEGMLQAIEQPIEAGVTVLFEGMITVRPNGPAQGRMPANIKDVLRDLMHLIPAMGAIKSAGFGEINQELTTIVEEREQPVRMNQTGDRLTVRIKLDQPILVDAERRAYNVIAGRSVIPGGALKGTVAEALGDAGQFRDASGGKVEALSQIIFGHAFPLVGDIRSDRALPAACAIAAHGGRRHARLAFEATDIFQLSAFGTPVFPMDWKPEDFEAAATSFNRPFSGVERQARGRVAINEAGVAAESKLFVTELVEPSARLWEFTLDRNGADRAVFEAVVETLAAGVAGLGRTGATMRLAACEAESPATPLRAGRVRIMLETPAVLTDPLVHSGPVLEQYRGYFAMLLGEGVSAFSAVATRRMEGDYYGYRFRAYGPDVYQPFEVTEPGAVFAFDVTDAAAAVLTGLLQTGLPPLVNGRLLEAKDGWRVCPFMNQNGYGAISLDDGWMDRGIAALESVA